VLGHRNDREHRHIRRHGLLGYTLMEVVAATAIFVTSVGILASTTTTALSSRVNLSRAMTLDSALNRVLETAASAPWEQLALNTFTPPAPLCAGDPLNAGTLAQTCLVVNGRSIPVTWSVASSVDAAGVDGIPQGSADSLVITATATRTDGTKATRTKTVMAPTAGYRVAPSGTVAQGVVRVQLSGSWVTLDSPLLLLAADNTTVVASTRVGTTGSAVMRADATTCTAALPCRVALGTGTSRGLTNTHSLDAGSVLGNSGKVVLSEGRATYVTAHIYRRGTLDVYLQAKNTTGGKQLSSTLSVTAVTSETLSAPYQGSVCLWASFADGYASQQVPSCNNTESGRAVTFDTYSPSATEPLLQLAVPTGEAISLLQDSTNADCPVVAGQTYHASVAGVGSWLPVTAVGVCSTWTWGRPTTLVTAAGTSSTFPTARITITGGGHTTAVATWIESDSARPAAGIPGTADLVWAKPRTASSCSGWPARCTPAWLSNKTASSPEFTACPTTACNSPSGTAPFFQYLTPTSSTARKWPYGLTVAANATATFSTTITDAESQSVTVSVPSVANGTLKMCTPGCTTVTAATTITVASGQTVQWSWTADSTATAATVGVRLVDSTGLARVEYLRLPKTANTPVAAWVMRTMAPQGGSDSNRAWVWNEEGNAAEGAAVTWSSCVTGSAVTAGDVGADGVAKGTWSVTTATPGTTTACSIQATKASVAYTSASSHERVVTAAPGSLTVTAAASTQGLPTVVSVQVLSPAGAALSGWNVAFSAETTSGAPAQSVWATPAWCVTGLDGRCSVTFQVGTDTTTTSWVAKAKAGSATASATSTITRKVARLSLSPVTLTAGESVTATIYTADGAGKALGSKTVALVAPSGVTVTPSTGTTDSTGALAVALTATNSVVIGEKTLQATSGTTVAALEFSLTPAPSSVTLERPQVTLTRGANGTLNVTVNGARGDAVSGALVTVTGGDAGVKVSSKLTTNVLGVAQLKLHVRSTAASGARTLTVVVAGVASQTFSVVVP
jgi:hypothetical protein